MNTQSVKRTVGLKLSEDDSVARFTGSGIGLLIYPALKVLGYFQSSTGRTKEALAPGCVEYWIGIDEAAADAGVLCPV